MADLAVVRNARTGKIDIQVANGSPVGDSSCTHRVFARLAAIRGAWWADVGGVYGRTQRKNIKRSTPSDIEADVRQALSPLVAAREILPPPGRNDLRVQVTLTRATGRADVDVGWSIPGGGIHAARYSLGL